MIKITKDSLIIEINTKNQSPLLRLQQIKAGLIDVLGICAVASEAPPIFLTNTLQQIHLLLSEMSFNETQMEAINESISKTPLLRDVFN